MSTPTEAQYAPIQEVPPSSPDSSLPFTGLDAGLMGAVALMVLIAGVVLRRAARDEV